MQKKKKGSSERRAESFLQDIRTQLEQFCRQLNIPLTSPSTQGTTLLCHAQIHFFPLDLSLYGLFFVFFHVPSQRTRSSSSSGGASLRATSFTRPC